MNLAQSDGNSSPVSRAPKQADKPTSRQATETAPKPLDVLLENVPGELLALSQWVCWRYETRNGKATKPPFQPSGARADVQKPATWNTFETVSKAYLSGGFHGIGFVISDSDPFCGIDLDGALDAATGKLDARAGAIVAALDSYTEKSPSGHGLRIWTRGTLPTGARRKGKIEAYDGARFLTFTGHRLDSTPNSINERGDELAKFHGEYLAPEAKPQKPKAALVAPIALDDLALLDKARGAENGAKFSALWSGDTTAYNGNHSEADGSLIWLLRFWTGADAARMDALFRQSGLMRPKWDERRGAATYGERTIQKAIAAGGAVYDRTPNTKPAPEVVIHSPSNSPVKLASASNFALTDTGNAERFAAQHSDRARFCWEWGVWLAWDGKRWTLDAGAEVERLAKATARGIYAEAGKQTDDAQRAELAKHAKRSESRKARADFLALARSEEGIPIAPDDLDDRPHLLNLQNGTFDLKAGAFRGHQRDDLLTHLCPVAYDATATAPTWDAALCQWLPDKATRDFVQDAAGASLCGAAFDEFWMFLFGDGANGKSTFTRVLEWLFGDYGHKAQAETFMDAGRDRDRGKPAPELLAMRGKRLITVQETAQRHRLNEALIKDLTGRDKVTARGIHAKHEVSFSPQFTLWMFGNHKPQVKDTSAGTWRRVRLIPFTQTIPEDERDPQLSERLRAELPGVLNWALDGLERVTARGFQVPDAVKAATEKYRAENDAYAGFFADFCETSKTAFVPASEIWEAWVSYCKETGEKEGTAKTLGQALEQRHFEMTRTYVSGRQIRVWTGLRLKRNEVKQDA